MKTHGGNLNAHYQLKKANLKSYILCEFNCDTLEKTKLWRLCKRISGFQGLEGRKR